MILGVLSLSAFTMLHVIISLVAIASGAVVLIGMLGSHRLPGCPAGPRCFSSPPSSPASPASWFPINGVTPAIGVGIVSLIVLVIALLALYGKHLGGSWRWIYVVSAVAALWFNGFVLVVQAFEKLSLINPHAPQVGPPLPDPQNTQFAIAQGVMLVLLLVLGLIAARKFHPTPAA